MGTPKEEMCVGAATAMTTNYREHEKYQLRDAVRVCEWLLGFLGLRF